MARASITGHKDVGRTWKQYAAGTYNLTTDAASPGGPARRLILLEDGDFSLLKDCNDNNRPLTGLSADFVFDAYITEVTCSVAFIAVW